MHKRRQIPVLTIAIALAALAIQICPALSDCLAYGRDPIFHGQIWRVWSGHLTHWSWNHLGWDLVAFLGLAGYCEHIDRRRWVILMAAAPLAISLTVLYGSPQMGVYRGLSGIDSAFYGLALSGFIEPRKDRKTGNEATIALIAAMIFLAKILYEIGTGGAVFATSAGSYIVVPSVHLAGFVAGLIVPAAVCKSSGQVCLTSRDSAAINM